MVGSVPSGAAPVTWREPTIQTLPGGEEGARQTALSPVGCGDGAIDQRRPSKWASSPRPPATQTSSGARPVTVLAAVIGDLTRLHLRPFQRRTRSRPTAQASSGARAATPV